ncbi:Transmembrane_domain-containing protein [Hexamita inflata]|uniref:Transmembrane domain-containing protein n=1 Tax=Hexamita inflata TaxID=28002 RepID=A0AA86UI93_9EUKA|nr:Transmembrane domain-containing protein [Hexamita inflata]
MDKIVHLLKKVPEYYGKMQYTDPLVMIIFSFHVTMGLIFICLRSKPFGSLLCLASALLVVLATKQIHIFLSMRQPKLLEEKLITMRYFDDEGSFAVFVIALPLFIISIVAGISLIVSLIVEICRAQKTITQQKKEAEESTKDKKNE